MIFTNLLVTTMLFIFFIIVTYYSCSITNSNKKLGRKIHLAISMKINGIISDKFNFIE